MKTFLNGLFLLVFLMPALLFAQTQVSGTVTDEANAMPLPGVNIIIKGTSTGASTDFDGLYSITVTEGQVLVFSYLGYETKEITFTNGSQLNVALKPDAGKLDEIVLIGYGSTTKQDATGAIEKVSDEEFNRGAIVAPQQLIAGKAAGVRVTTGGGAAGEGGEIRIRGGASLSASNSPLIVIDGLPIDQSGAAQGSANALNAINPADIEDFVVLKDASATAIYGSRASNGVILITTKKGSVNQPLKIEYGLQISTRRVANTIDVLDADQYRDLASNPGFDSSSLGNANTDWQDEIYTTGVGAIHNITVSKGYERSNFRINFNHASQEGPLQDLYERNGINASFVQRLLDNDLKLTLVTKAVQDEFSYANRGAIGAATRFDPTQSVLDNNGNFTQYGSDANLAPANPLFLLEEYDNRQTIQRLISNFNLDYNFWFLRDLTLTVNAGIDYAENDGHRFEAGNPNNPDAFALNEISSGQNRNTSLDFYLNYKKEIESINTKMDITAGHAFQEFYRSSFFDRSTNISISQRDINRNALESYFARGSFDIADKYLISANIRRDGSSRFSEDNRIGYFPGVSVGWKVMNESFMENSLFSNLKLRAGWGVQGQQEIGPNYGYQGLYTPSRNQAANIQFGTQPNGDPRFISTIRPEPYDENLKWEETTQYNVAVDFGFFNNRLSGSIDAYYRETEDLLSLVPVPAGANLTDILLTNVGQVTSKGLEISLNGVIMKEEDFGWDTNFNITFQEQEITSLSLNDDPDYFIPTGGINGGVGNNIQILKPGFDPSTFFVFRQVYDNDGNAIEGAYVDVNGDNIITEADRQAYKKATPDAFIGFTNNFRYKNLDLNFTFRGNFGNYVYNNSASENGNLNNVLNQPGYQANAHASLLDTGFGNQNLFSDLYIQRADFIRLDNISFGYTIPFEKIIFRASLTANNVFVITEYDGLDPEISNGIENNFYPRTRDIVLGLNFTF
ncbi:SusC/RagA family TonB-linked outer membrane protein [Subsaximicrobium wynnwilliamsii]|uniref:SusC/RagA family TonB-linked outer membrane protein n=1 Tax=Subsaximicrobium wynnwilliamsii TaxID=291179 RepID=A0A5C6ZKQ2_9FLAO|nr:SusC/RagA family TonB-linked outer membrane protein [Subsaximicrobium wynnwilliamsii]TXD85558.1 SusC/RagA family TonB-linked outer membrane protein [Subsaximicrobium wynnwilliamsii]TXD90911.1 SusC/RagA family TonB-linked outer membrane protein [Subsaximicrobium wynnwilliamsii]TXE05418.1 SusC/RagA family TonB-linked outer membrane protein [Subsaximicrobium wynnwilliamsii]